MSLSERAFKGVIWSSALSLGIQASSFLMAFGLARVLGKAVFGEWGIIQNTVISIAGIAQLSMAVTATKYVAEHRDSNPSRVGSILGLCSFVTSLTGLAGSVALVAFAVPIARDTLHAEHLALALRVSAIHLFFLTVNGFQIGALSGLELFRPLAIIGLLYGLGSTACVLVLASYFGLNGAVIGLSFATAISWLVHRGILNRVLNRRKIQISYRELSLEMPVLTGFTIPATLSGIAGSVGLWLSSVILVRHSQGFEQMAILSAAGSFKSVILFMPNVITRVSMPLLVNLFGKENQARYKMALSKSIWVIIGFALLAAIPIALFGHWLLLAFGKAFEGGGTVVTILAIATVFEVAALGYYQELFSAGAMWSSFLIAAVRSLILVLGAYQLVPNLGAKGAAYATLISQCFGLGLTLWIVTRSWGDLRKSEYRISVGQLSD